MRCVIMISESPEKYVSCSVQQKVQGGKRISFTSDMDEAEFWIDPDAAKAWCESNDYPNAVILQIDAPVRLRPTEVRRLEPKGRALSGAEQAAVRERQEARVAAEQEEEAEEAPTPKPKKASARKLAKPAKPAKPGKKVVPPVTDEERALAAMEAMESHAASGHDVD